MTVKLPHTLCVFVNDQQKLYHIWATKQEQFKKNVNIANAFSKAAYALSGKDSAQSGATTSFYRVLANTNINDWVVDYVELDHVSKKELEENYKIYKDLLEDQGYTCCSRSNTCRIQTGKYAGKKWKATKLENLRYAQVKTHALNMLQDCFYSAKHIDAESNIVARAVLKLDSQVENISQMWQYVYNTYHAAK